MINQFRENTKYYDFDKKILIISNAKQELDTLQIKSFIKVDNQSACNYTLKNTIKKNKNHSLIFTIISITFVRVNQYYKVLRANLFKIRHKKKLLNKIKSGRSSKHEKYNKILHNQMSKY